MIYPHVLESHRNQLTAQGQRRAIPSTSFCYPHHRMVNPTALSLDRNLQVRALCISHKEANWSVPKGKNYSTPIFNFRIVSSYDYSQNSLTRISTVLHFRKQKIFYSIPIDTNIIRFRSHPIVRETKVFNFQGIEFSSGNFQTRIRLIGYNFE